MRTVAIWHGSIADAVRFANQFSSTACELVTLVSDPEMRFAWWGFYRVNPQAYDVIRNTPRLTYKNGEN